MIRPNYNTGRRRSLMISYIWPMALIVLSNTVYQICAKSMPEKLNPFAALTVTYAVAAVSCAVMFFTIGRGSDLIGEYSKLNWVPFTLGVVIVGLEVGWVFAYKAGWQVSTGFIVQSAFLAVALVFVGYLLFKEEITWNKLAGVAICLVGLGFINFK